MSYINSLMRKRKLMNSNARNIKSIIFLVIFIVLILIIIDFTITCINNRQKILKRLHSEANNLTNIISNEINYSKFFIKLMGTKLKSNYQDINYIHKTFQDYVSSSNFNNLLGERKYSWINKNFREVVSSTRGIQSISNEQPYIREIVESSLFQEKINFYTYKTIDGGELELIINLVDNRKKEYVGSIVLSHDITAIISLLNASKHNNYTNFILLDDKLKVVTQSKALIKNIINTDGGFSTHLITTLKQGDFLHENAKDISYSSIFQGFNYYIKKIDDLPFILIINIDSDYIKSEILNNLIKEILEGAIVASIFIIISISLYKRETKLRANAEQATIIANKATKAKSDFLAFAAHEIRSPLSFILTGSEIMLKELFGKLLPSYKQYAADIHQNSKIILDFITDILDENQILEGKFKIINSTVSIEDIITKVIEVNKLRFNKRKFNIISNLELHLPKLVCDQARMLQVMNNLISNAIKYSNDNTIITINAKIVHNKLEIEIIDQGIGMSNDEIKIALDATGVIYKKNYDSIKPYGLGLRIVKMLLDAHNANLLIKSNLHLGTKVTIIFPEYRIHL